MIRNKVDYKKYLEEDAKTYQHTIKYPMLQDSIIPMLANKVFKFQCSLRRLEYFINCKNTFFYKLYILYLKYNFVKQSIALGFSIPLNALEKGCQLGHHGCIVISSKTKIGENCILPANIVIARGVNDKHTSIGKNCYIGAGTVIINGACIGNNVTIGANSLVNKDFLEDDIVIAGNPAKIIKYKKNN